MFLQSVARAGRQAAAAAALLHGQCRLTLSGANLLLSRFGGNKLIINGTAEAIPAAGVSLAPTALAIDTNFFIYAFMSAGVMTLEASATGHSTSTASGNEGVEIKTGDETRTLVGFARTITGPAWVDDATRIYVLSWFNPRPKSGVNRFTVDRSTTSQPFVELNTEIRVSFLTWAGYPVALIATGTLFSSAANAGFRCALGVDGATPEAPSVMAANAGGGTRASIGFTAMASPSEASHFATLLGGTDNGAYTATWRGTDDDSNRACRVQVLVMG